MSVSVNDVAYYLGYGNSNVPDSGTYNLIKGCIVQMERVAIPHYVYKEFDLQFLSETKVSFADVVLDSKSLSLNLKNCRKVVLVAMTIGSEVDALIRRWQYMDSTKAVILQACGAAFAEDYMEQFNSNLKEEYSAKGYKCHPRFSPGFGDVPLEIQKVFFRLLPCDKIGLTLMDSLIMAPEKSITAFIGVEKF